MAKKADEQEETEMEEETGRGGKLQWFCYVVLIPLLFAIAMALIVATFSGINVIGKAASVEHKITNLFAGDDKEPQKQSDPAYSSKQYSGQITKLEKQLDERDKEIDKLQSQLDSSRQKNLKTEQQVKDLQAQLKKAQQSQAANKKKIKEIASTYENMSPDNAASILVKMSDTEATQILSQLSSDTLASVLEKMSAENAAKYTKLLTNKGT
ncbi:MotE family protein [Heyndrickxia acidiproducens]|uniref:MotE family protein n=1 Tax=Heyndrickxia acidiproducens TaxID=1121084 RepID=UPI000366AE5C|nr:MotE family protein [Heyndrickxia acidiproducens]